MNHEWNAVTVNISKPEFLIRTQGTFFFFLTIFNEGAFSIIVL